jgi:hypothetical protein
VCGVRVVSFREGGGEGRGSERVCMYERTGPQSPIPPSGDPSHGLCVVCSLRYKGNVCGRECVCAACDRVKVTAHRAEGF